MVGGRSGELGATAVVTVGLVFVIPPACAAVGLLVLEKTEFLRHPLARCAATELIGEVDLALTKVSTGLGCRKPPFVGDGLLD